MIYVRTSNYTFLVNFVSSLSFLAVLVYDMGCSSRMGGTAGIGVAEDGVAG